MLKKDLPYINLEGYKFNCSRCGNCCKVLVKTNVSKMDLIYRYDYQGKLSKSPFTTTTVFYNEIRKTFDNIDDNIDDNIKNRNDLFVPFTSFYLKDFPVEFTYSYQVKTKGKWCIFYDFKKKSCNIYNVRPLVCKAYPLYVDKAIFSGTIVHKPNIAPCSDVDNDIRIRYPNIKNLMNVQFDPKYSTYEIQFPNQAEYFKLGTYMEKKVNIFIETWSSLLINPLNLNPNIVKKYERLDMSQYFAWLGENKEKI